MFMAILCAQSRIERPMADLSFVSFDIDKVMMEVDPLLFGDYCRIESLSSQEDQVIQGLSILKGK
jgi:hypothetical protein